MNLKTLCASLILIYAGSEVIADVSDNIKHRNYQQQNENIGDFKGRNKLMIALANGEAVVAKSLLNDENKTKSESDLINLDDRDREGRTALIYSIKSKYLSDKDRVEIVKLFLRKGASVNIQNKDGKTALDYSITSDGIDSQDRVEIVKLLLENGADPNIQDEDNETALMRAADADELNYTNRVEIVKLLLKYRAKINVQDEDGKTALMKVIKSKKVENKDRVEIVKLLLENGADPKIASYKGKTALTYAVAMRNEEIIKILRNAENTK